VGLRQSASGRVSRRKSIVFTSDRRLLERLLRRDYAVVSAGSGEEALRLLEQHDVALLITDQRMPGMSGIELLKLTAPLRPHMVRITLTGYTDVTALVEAINCGQVYKYVTKPWSNDELRLTVGRALEHYETSRSRHELALTNQRLVNRMKEMTLGFVRAIAGALEAKDGYTLGHARRVRGYAAAIGRWLGLAEESLEQLALAAFLHDIGKIGTPEHILLKLGLLTPEESAQMRRHARRGARMLTGIVGLEEAADAVLHHHERFDGAGYPEGLRGEQIPLNSRIILVADAYDAMTSPRPFRDACSHEEAVARLEEGAGSMFDPEVVRAFGQFEQLAQIRRAVAAGPSASAPGGSDVSGLTFEELIEVAAVFDAQMPHLTGPDLIDHMRTEKRLMRIPVMIMSGGRGPLLTSRALLSGASVFLPKPFTPTQLRGMLRVLEYNGRADRHLSAV
jgi:putative two-component system response regulator